MGLIMEIIINIFLLPIKSDKEPEIIVPTAPNISIRDNEIPANHSVSPLFVKNTGKKEVMAITIKVFVNTNTDAIIKIFFCLLMTSFTLVLSESVVLENFPSLIN